MNENKKNINEQIELRSEEVQDIMGQIPPWILRWGITLIFILLAIFFVGSYFFKYPDALTAEVTLTTASPPVELYTRSTGKLEFISVTNKQHVNAGAILAVIDNTANFSDVELFNYLFSKWERGEISACEFNNIISRRNWQLGDLQVPFGDFCKSIKDYILYQEFNYYPKKIALKAKQDKKQHEMDFRQRIGMEMNKRQALIAGHIYHRDSLLYIKRINTGEEYDRALQTYLQSRQTIVNDTNSQKQMEMRHLQDQETLLDLKQQYKETHEQCVLALSNSANQLDAQIKIWERNYVVKSPISGYVNLMSVWSSNQSVTAGDLIFIVIPEHSNATIGRAKLPATGAGKVKIGQSVDVRINNYPDQEFGFLSGKVNNISEIPDKDGNYFIEITFPNGLITNYGKRLPPSKQMSGTAQIIIRDIRLLERFIQPLEKVIKDSEQ